ncbi:MAG: CHAT domain-containing protein, partial [Acidobacteriota bacterium]
RAHGGGDNAKIGIAIWRCLNTIVWFSLPVFGLPWFFSWLMGYYSVGEEQSYLFAVEPDRVEANVVALDVGKAALQAEIERFRTDLERGRIDRRLEKALLPARRLSERLLAPVADQLARADRLLILADGPLHSLPFAALTDPTTANRRRFLIESMPLHRAASATVFARLKQERDERRATRLAAFGDPHYPTSLAPNGQAAPPSPPLQAALRGGLDLKPLPATRSEILALAQLYPQTAQVYLGAEATEGRAKTVGRETTHLHIASHGLLDDRFPLDSALALTIPSSWREGDDNGLLQAWEIFEQVRIDADLVTLSACDTGRGKVLGGEGLIGLTRAFQYAGARSVLASLWGVGDHSTAELMQRFYRSLEQGEPKAEALRRAQLELLHGAEYSHPFHWAGFELVGDWR